MDSAEPLPSWLWRNSWKYSSFFATPLSQMLAYTTEILHWQFFFHPQHFFSLLILWGLFWGGFFWFGFVCVFFPCGFFFFFFCTQFILLVGPQRSLSSQCRCEEETLSCLLSLAWEDISPNRMTTAVASSSTKQTSFCWTETEQAIIKGGRVRKEIMKL